MATEASGAGGGSAAASGGPTSTLPLKDTLHCGDLVLIRCRLDHSGHSDGIASDVGYVKACGLTGEAEAVRVSGAFHEDTEHDVRDFMFTIAEQLTYTAYKDLRRLQKHLAKGKSAPTASQAHHLRNLQARAEDEGRRNADAAEAASQRPLHYGSIVQLRHLRTKRYVTLKTKLSAPLQSTSRRVELQAGSNSSWFRINPCYAHKMQGEPVPLLEAVYLESVKLADGWNLNWARCKNLAKDEVFEVNCAKGGEGFSFELYSRAVEQEPGSKSYALNSGQPFTIFMPHFNRYLAASATKAKTLPYLRRPHQDNGSADLSAKVIWELELVSTDVKDHGIKYNMTVVLLRHFASGRYLALRTRELLDERLVLEDQVATAPSAVRRATAMAPPPTLRRAMSSEGAADRIAAELVDVPGISSMFVLEGDTHLSRLPGTRWVPADSPSLMLRWDHSVNGTPLWLSCSGQTKGSRQSLELYWAFTRHTHNVVRFDLVPEATMVEPDVVVEHRLFLSSAMRYFTRCKDEKHTEWMMYARIERALADMIRFLADAPSWRGVSDGPTPQDDALRIPWRATPQRQVLVRELRYIDVSFELLDELRRQTPGMMKDINFNKRKEMKAQEQEPANQAQQRTLSDTVERLSVPQLRTRCLKLVVRMWVFCFLHSREAENHFHKRGWMKRIDNLNGYGVGASDVFVALVADNPHLVRCVGDETMARFIHFVRVLGPLDTWLNFLLALCAPQGQAVASLQQDVCCAILFAGLGDATGKITQTQAAAHRNKEELLVAMRLDQPIGVPLIPGGGDVDEGLARRVISHGVHDIGISWAHPKVWEVGQGVLFHGPEHLKLPRLPSDRDKSNRTWVSLNQVVWPLQPERCCEYATGISWHDLKNRDAGASSHADVRPTSLSNTGEDQRVDQLRMLGQYILAQLRLMAGLAKERQMNCIMAMQDEYSCSLCLSGASDVRLPSSIRGAFFDLLTDVWVDRFPHVQIVVPQLYRCLPSRREGPPDEPPAFELEEEEVPDSWSNDHLRSLPEEVREFYRLKTQSKMKALVHAVRRHLCAGPEVEQQIHSAKQDNALMLAVLRNLSYLIRFGFVPCSVMLEICGPLLRCLDGRTDWLDVHQTPIWTSSMGNDVSEEQQPNIHPEIAPLLGPRSASAPHGGELSFTRARFPPLDDSARRYVSSSDNKTTMEAKVQMARVLRQIMQYGMEKKIAHAVQRFHALGNSSETAELMVEEVLELLDGPPFPLEQERIWSPNIMLLDLAMYEDPQLFALAVELLCGNAFQAAELFDHLEKVSLMAAEQQRLAVKLKRDVTTLGQLLYSFETWGVDDGFSGIDKQKFQQFSDICNHIRTLCRYGSDGVTSGQVQGMLCQMEFLSHVRYMLTLDPKDFSAGCRQMLVKVSALLCGAAAMFARGNHETQNLTMKVVPNASTLMDELPGCALILAEVFRGNLELCQRVPEALIRQFGDLAARERRAGHFVPWYVSFFTAILTVGDKPVPRNQVLVLETITRLTPKQLLRLGKEMSTSHILEMAGRFASQEYMLDQQPDHLIPRDVELIYYCCCLEVCTGLAHGHSSESLVLKPFVGSVFPMANALRMILAMDDKSMAQKSTFSMHRHLRVKWLALVNTCLYQVQKELLDVDLLRSPLHAEFLSKLLGWLVRLLGLPSIGGGQGRVTSRPPPGSWAAPEVCKFEAEYLEVMLRCVDSFFGGPVMLLRGDGVLQELQRVLRAYLDHFAAPVRSSAETACDLEAGELLQVAAHRVATALGDPSASQRRIVYPQEDSPQTRTTSGGVRGVQAEWSRLIAAVREHPRVRDRLGLEEQEFGRMLSSVRDHTDPEYVLYAKVLPADPEGQLPAHCDFRRGRIEVEDMLKRWVRHTANHLDTDVPSLRRVQRMLLTMVHGARSSEDPQALTTLQGQLVDAGVTQLLVQVLDSRLAHDVSATSWRLLSGVLHGQGKVNKSAQVGLYKAISTMEDSGLWQTFHELMEETGHFTKRARALKIMPSLAAWEKQLLAEYDEHLTSADIALHTMRLMVEGHYVEMQDYLFTQMGNSRSVNVLETSCLLLKRFCSDEASADTTEEREVDVIDSVLALLIELAQGPNLRNQEHLSHLGLVETVFKLLSANFVQLQRAAGDVYPSRVRLLKSQFVQVLLALLEGRQDKRIHATMISRIDLQVVRERIVFVYLYFIFGTRDVSSGRASGSKTVAVPLGGQTQRLLMNSVGPTELFNELEKANDLALELLEDLTDDELGELFSEGLDILQLVLELSPHSKDFAADVIPKAIEFVDDPSNYATEREYITHRSEFHKAEVYRVSYEFLRRFVCTIEVVLNGDLQNLHFHQPLTAMFYMQNASKQHILETVPFSSPDIKAKAFIQMCQEVHEESKLIRQLSKFSILTGSTRRWAQMNLPDGAHRPFQLFLTDDAWRMQQLLKWALALSITLGIHVGTFLVPAQGSRERGHLVWVSPLAQEVAAVQGGLYCTVTLIWLSLTACIKVSMHTQRLSTSNRPRWRCMANARALLNFLREPPIVWRSLLLLCALTALVSEHVWIYAFLLTDCFCQSPRLATVLGGVVSPLRSLAMTSLGATIVTFAYAAVGFHYFRKDFGHYCQDSVIVCTQNIVYQSTRNGIVGLSSMMEKVMPGDDMWTMRVVYDVSFFVVTGIMLLNTVVALIVDSFSHQRRGADARETNQETETFISCIDRKIIDTVAAAVGISDGFEYHEQHLQPKWDYMAFIFYLREKDAQDYTGPEQIIKNLVKQKDINWVPLGRSKLLEEDKSHIQEDTLARIEKQGRHILGELEGGARSKQLLLSTLGVLTRTVEERMEAMQQQMTVVAQSMHSPAAPP